MKAFPGETWAITAAPDKPVAQSADRVVIATPAIEESYCHTVSFACAVAAGQALRGLDVSSLADEVERALSAEPLPVSSHDRFVVAGSQDDFAVRLEAVLKLREGARVAAESHHVEQLLHGHLSAIDESVRCFVLEGSGRGAERARDAVRALELLGCDVTLLPSAHPVVAVIPFQRLTRRPGRRPWDRPRSDPLGRAALEGGEGQLRMNAEVALAIVDAVWRSAGGPVSVVVADDHGEPIASLRMDGAALDTLDNATRKAYTAARSDAMTTRELAEKAGRLADGAGELRPSLFVLPRWRRRPRRRPPGGCGRGQRSSRPGRRVACDRSDQGVGSGATAAPERGEQLGSRTGSRPTPSTVAACSSVPSTVSSSGRTASPASWARSTSASRKCRHASCRVSIQSGSSIHSPTPWSARNASSTAVNCGSVSVTITHAWSSSASGYGRDVALNVPGTPPSGALHQPVAEVANVDGL